LTQAEVVFPSPFLVGDQYEGEYCEVQSEYKVGRCTRRCQKQDRPLAPGEWYYSVVSEGDDEETLIRSDISAQAWQGPPEGTLGWWKSRMPEAGARKLKLAPDAVLVDLLRQSGVMTGPIRYLLALMLLRRRLIQPVNQPTADLPANQQEFEIVDDGSRVVVNAYRFAEDQAKALGEQLTELLYCEVD
jgi:hypothetical protein